MREELPPAKGSDKPEINTSGRLCIPRSRRCSTAPVARAGHGQPQWCPAPVPLTEQPAPGSYWWPSSHQAPVSHSLCPTRDLPSSPQQCKAQISPKNPNQVLPFNQCGIEPKGVAKPERCFPIPPPESKRTQGSKPTNPFCFLSWQSFSPKSRSSRGRFVLEGRALPMQDNPHASQAGALHTTSTLFAEGPSPPARSWHLEYFL